MRWGHGVPTWALTRLCCMFNLLLIWWLYSSLHYFLAPACHAPVACVQTVVCPVKHQSNMLACGGCLHAGEWCARAGGGAEEVCLCASASARHAHTQPGTRGMGFIAQQHFVRAFHHAACLTRHTPPHPTCNSLGTCQCSSIPSMAPLTLPICLCMAVSCAPVSDT